VPDFETITYQEDDGIVWVTLNRPDVLNAFNQKMRDELKFVWRELRYNDDARVVVLTAAGDRAFCTGIDREESINPEIQQKALDSGKLVGYPTPWTYDDPGFELGPKANDLWKPVIAAVNGIACAGAFYMLGEVEFIIAADHATFFDPHVTFGMTACFESMHMLQKMPFHEIMRGALLGSSERMSAERAYQIGLVSEVVPFADLQDAAGWAAGEIAASPPIAVQGTVRSLWAAQELSRAQALDMGKVIIRAGSDRDSLYQGQQRFASGERKKPRIR
jgi:enoyl-CoA hydratase/carnithine racemase